jgi:GMP synthase (glutamine-hydrolysing)
MAKKSILCGLLLMMLCGCQPRKTDILVLDYGSSATPKIAKRLAQLHVTHLVTSEKLTAEQITKINPKGIILSGGPPSVVEKSFPKPVPEIYDMGIPVLGICYGLQLMAAQLGGTVGKCQTPEIGVVPMTITGTCDLYPDNMKELKVWMFHHDCLQSAPPGFKVTGHTKHSTIAMACNPDKKLYGVQFHPERFDKSPEATIIIDRFVSHIVGISKKP